MLFDPSPQTGGRFGASTLIADLNLDGHGDLIVGAPGKNVGTVGGAGQVYIRPGPISGTPTTWLTITEPAATGGPQIDGQFGFRLATGDFNADGYPDLAVTAIGATIDPGYFTGFEQGQVIVLFGPFDYSSPAIFLGVAVGLTEPNDKRINAPPGPGDRFGYRLAVGDPDVDDRDDLIIGAPFSDVPKPVSGTWFLAGEAYCFFGDMFTPFSRLEYIPHPDTNGDTIGPEDDCLWGLDIVVGNFKDNPDFPGPDVVIAAYNKDYPPPNGYLNQGEFFVYLDWRVTGSFDPARSVYLTYDRPCVECRQGADCGWEMTAGRFDGDNFDDLLVGAPRGFTGGIHSNLGEAILYPGGPQMGQYNPNNFWFVAPEVSIDIYDRFGSGLALLDQDGDGLKDEVIAAGPWFDADPPAAPLRGEGRAWLIQSFGAMNPDSSRVPTQWSAIADPTPEDNTGNPGWGWANVEIGKLNGNTREDAVIGNPSATYLLFENAGEVRVIIW